MPHIGTLADCGHLEQS